MLSVEGRGESSKGCRTRGAVEWERMEEAKNEMEGHRMLSAGKEYSEW